MSLRTILAFLLVGGASSELSSLHGQAVPPSDELPVQLQARRAAGGGAIDLIVPKSDTAGVVELHGASDLARLFTLPESLRLTNAPTGAALLWRLPVEQTAFYRGILRPGAAISDYLPKITAQPQAATADEGGQATISVTTAGLAPQSYQWQFHGTNLTSETGQTLRLTNVSPEAQGPYRVIVTSAAGSVTSESAQLTVNPSLHPAPEGMVWLPSGTFVIGTPVGERDRAGDEVQHTVEFTKGFFIGRHEVTQAEYTAVMGANPSGFKGTNLPVENVTWYDATNYCSKLTAGEHQSGRLPAAWEYRLPTEAQWEYACRAGTTTAAAFGTTLNSTQANFDGRYPYNQASYGPALNRTTPVGSYEPNAWGLYDMHGNVWEWCADWYGDYPPGAVADPQGPDTGIVRILRGGSWNYPGWNCRSGFRGRHGPTNRHNFLGFRVVLVRSR